MNSLKPRKVFTVIYGMFVFLVAIALTGFAANFALYIFHALILGWGDSGPEWYIEIEQWLFYGIFVAAAVLWIVVVHYRHTKNRKRLEV